jgi:hypothetical protein
MEEAWDGKTSGAIGFALSFLVYSKYYLIK